jgi:hypothetical protein
MLSILRAKRLVYITTIYGEEWKRIGYLCMPTAGTTQKLDIDYMSQFEPRGRENGVAHRKYSGTLTDGMVTRDGIKILTSWSGYSGDHFHHETWSTGMNSFYYSDHWGDSDRLPAWLRGKPNTEYTHCRYLGAGQYEVTEVHHSYDYDNKTEFDWSPTESIMIMSYTDEVPFTSNDPVTKEKVLSFIPEGWDPEKLKPDKDFWSVLFQEACHGVFPLETNNIANAMQLVDLTKALVDLTKTVTSKGKYLNKFFIASTVKKALATDAMPVLRKHVNPKAAASAWLAYRYAYTTTKLDIEEHRAHLSEAMDEFAYWGTETFVRHATAVRDNTVYNMKIVLRPKVSTSLQALWVKLRALGLQPNLVNGWDIVPLSFVADWFLPIESLLQAVDDSCTFTETNFTFLSTPLVSTKEFYEVSTPYGIIQVSSYLRWDLGYLPIFLPVEENTATKTKIMRSVDGASLVVGMI